MNCPNCKKEAPLGKEMCSYCGAPIKSIPVPPGGKIWFGKYEWYVLDKQDGKVLILTERVIEKRAYHNQECEITWETCDMRKYLNDEFYNSFNEADRQHIIEVRNENNDNPWYGTSGGNPTTDKIFLLSIEEVLQYFGDSGQIKTRYMYPNCDWCKDEYLPWIDDQYSLNRRAVDDTGIVRDWRLRSPGAMGCSVANVMGFDGDGFDMGPINIVGPCGEFIDGHFIFKKPGSGNLSSCPDYHNPNGVRPALWLRTE